jgi:hypothetical protein
MYSTDNESDHKPHAFTDDRPDNVAICVADIGTHTFTVDESKCESECEPDGVTIGITQCESECESECDAVCVADVVS